MKKYIYTLILASFSTIVFGQQEIQNTYFMYNQQLNNPAYVGSRGVASFTALYRNQWTGFEGAPVAQTLSFQSPFMNERVGFGATVSHFKQGITNSWFTSLAYSYKIPLTDDISVRLGLQASLKFLGIDFADDRVVLSALDDPSISMNEMHKEYLINVGAGAFMTFKELFYIGVAVPQIYPNDFAINPTNTIAATNRPHLYINLGANLKYTDKITFSPNVLIKYVENAPLDFDINANLIFNQKFVTGVSYRAGGDNNGESVDFLLMYQISPQLSAGMAYDLTLSRIKNFSSGTYEVLLRYDLGQELKDLENPRYF